MDGLLLLPMWFSTDLALNMGQWQLDVLRFACAEATAIIIILCARKKLLNGLGSVPASSGVETRVGASVPEL